ncbi:MAG: DUF2723 domain-containing protein [bacterium]
MQQPQNIMTAAPKKERFLSKWEWCAFLIVTLISFGLYAYSLAPSVTLEDSGELATAADNLGVPHPPGYPLWTILAWVFSKLLWFVTFRNQPNPAWTIALASAVFGALTSGLIAMLICRSGRDMLAEIRKKSGATDTTTDNLICWAGSISASLLFAFSMAMWTQSNIVEVYSLNALVVAVILLLGYAWMHMPSNKFLYGIALAFGLGMGDWYPSILLVAFAIVVLIMIRDIELFRDFCAVGMVLVGMIVLNIILTGMSGEALPDGSPVHPWASGLLWINGPYHFPFWAYLLVNLAVIGLGAVFLPRGKTVAICFILAELGMLIYLYMPLASDLNNPPMNWAYPRTWEGFIHAITRGQYEKIAPGAVFDPAFLDQMRWYGDCLRVQYTLPLCLAGTLALAGWSVQVRKYRISALIPGLLLLPVAAVVLSIGKLRGPGALTISGAFDFGDLILMPMVLLAVMGLVAIVLGIVTELARKMTAGTTLDTASKTVIALILIGGLLLLLYYEWSVISLIAGSTPTLSTAGKLQVAAILVFGPILLTSLVAWLIHGPARMRFDYDDTLQKWIIVTFVAFIFMSVFMVVMSNLKGDIQDMFIQKVKFIPSYELFSLWIGYGMILGLALVRRLLSAASRALAGVAAFVGIAVMLVLPAYPVAMNAPFVECIFNREMLVDEGGANARGDDYGWQFGNYQLCGMEAIQKELERDEPPPPSKSYPPPMGQDAIFFGGTDPGRFVPTYMIYSAHVREDVYLITQNALADHTYMSVMRDLYGDRIWIPALVDNQQAFSMFADEVRRGVRPGNVDIKGGRVVVQGVDQVMAINGILCKMIHDRNKWRHPFYVEESYVMPWMYPYMEPHGLILKINAEPLQNIPPETVKNDMEFWDWYSKRMIKDENFINNAVARKTFSKLRSAIAGLYESRQMWKEAEQAYREAVTLCPVSPEASFRLASMCMNRAQIDPAQMDVARQVMKDFAALDSQNPRPAEMIREIDRRKQMLKRKEELELELRGAPTIQSVMELALLYRAMGNVEGFRQLARSIVDNTGIPVEAQMQVLKWYQEGKLYDDMEKGAKAVLSRAGTNMPINLRQKIYREISGMYASANKLAEATDALQMYLSLTPLDFMSWHELGVMLAYISKHDEAARAFLQAGKIAGDRAREEFRRDPRMEQFRNRPEYRRMSVSGQ